jgi:hypothetical protein
MGLQPGVDEMSDQQASGVMSADPMLTSLSEELSVVEAEIDAAFHQDGSVPVDRMAAVRRLDAYKGKLEAATQSFLRTHIGVSLY